MSRRHQDALAISEGACNPSGIANALVNACRECIAEEVVQRDDPAVRLILSQLAYICGIWDGVADWPKGDFHHAYEDCRQAVERMAQEAA